MIILVIKNSQPLQGILTFTIKIAMYVPLDKKSKGNKVNSKTKNCKINPQFP